MEALKREIVKKLYFSHEFMSRSNPGSQIWFPSRGLIASLLFSTKTQARTKCSTLYGRIEKERDPKASIVPILDQWVTEGKTVTKSSLQSLVRLMKDYKRFNHALEISHWMTDRRYFPLSPGDVAVRLELIYRVHRLVQAEQYFQKLSDKLKTYKVYGALLLGYIRENSVDKAEAIMQEMNEKGMANLSFPYNIMINLYTQVGQFEKINLLIQEMEKNRIPYDECTTNNLLAAYVAASNISAMEGILNQFEKDPQLGPNWRVYTMAASGYLKVGSTEKALAMLRKAEKNMPMGKKTLAFNFLLTLYAETGKKDELYRIWNRYKPKVQVKETQFCCIITCLSKLDDIEGVEKIFKEWESQCTTYDFRVLNRLLVAYCKKGLLDKAEAALEKAVEGRLPYASTWNIMAMGYLKHNQMSKAVDMLKRAISVSRKGWKPNPTTLAACLDYLEEQADVNQMEEIIKSLKSLEPLSKDLYHRLVRTYTAAQRPVGELPDLINVDDNAATEQMYKILETNSTQA